VGGKLDGQNLPNQAGGFVHQNNGQYIHAVIPMIDRAMAAMMISASMRVTEF
jgi:hypothetical protein